MSIDLEALGEDPKDDTWHQLNAETARIEWPELQRHYASGSVVSIANSLSLIDVAYAFAKDDKAAVQAWVEQQLVGPVSDELAKRWVDHDPVLWAVVVSPFVLVQEEIKGAALN